MKPGPSPETIRRIEAIEGCTAGEALTRRYLVDKLSYRKICARWNINTRTLMRLMSHFQITPRKGSEAVKTQWLHDSGQRRRQAAMQMKELSEKMKAAGYHPRRGKTKDVDEGTRRASDKLRKSTSARRPEVRRKMSAAHVRLVKRQIPRHPTSNAPPTKAEKLTLDHLTELGYQVIHNHVVSTDIGPRWLNVFLPDLNLAVECESFGRFPLSWERHCAVSGLGIRLVYITNNRIYAGAFAGLDKYVSLTDVLRPNPAAHGQNTVVWGRINPTVFKNQPPEVAVKRILVDRCHTLLLTTAADDPVMDAYRLDSAPSTSR